MRCQCLIPPFVAFAAVLAHDSDGHPLPSFPCMDKPEQSRDGNSHTHDADKTTLALALALALARRRLRPTPQDQDKTAACKFLLQIRCSMQLAAGLCFRCELA